MSGSMGSTGLSGGTTGQTSTGATNVTYDLVSVLYHALETSSTLKQYIQDAQQSGDSDLAQFFQQVDQQNRQCAQQAQQLLGQRLSGGMPTH